MKETQNVKDLIVPLKEHLVFWRIYLARGKGKVFGGEGTLMVIRYYQ